MNDGATGARCIQADLDQIANRFVFGLYPLLKAEVCDAPGLPFGEEHQFPDGVPVIVCHAA